MDGERRETVCLPVCVDASQYYIDTTSLRRLLYLARLLASQPAPLLLLLSALLRSQLCLQLLELKQGLQHLSWYADTTTGSTGFGGFVGVTFMLPR